jgi:hypothetical protein
MITLQTQVCIIGATPAGICAAIAAARDGARVVLAERSAHIGGLPANGLGATDIHLREATTGLFAAFVEENRRHYAHAYGEASEQLAVSKGGLHFEPSVAEQTFWTMLQPWLDRVTVLTRHEFDHTDGRSVRMATGARGADGESAGGRAAATSEPGNTIATVRMRDLASGTDVEIAAGVFLDCTYEGDLMASAGVPYATGRESRTEHGESYAGVLYKLWMGEPNIALSTGEGDDRLQAYNYRLCLTGDPTNRIPLERPSGYDRSEYVSLIDDIAANRWTGRVTDELETEAIGRVVNIIRLPNGKTDANNQHLSFLSTDLPEENSRWPDAPWSWRDSFATRLREYTEGLLWFMANDPEVPAGIREAVGRYGWPRDEYEDNQGFPRAVYVREARRMRGRYLFTQHDVALKYPDALSAAVVGRRQTVPAGRIHATSITAGCYAIDSIRRVSVSPRCRVSRGCTRSRLHPTPCRMTSWYRTASPISLFR